MKRVLVPMFCLSMLVVNCATESHREIEPEVVAKHGTPYSGPKRDLALGNFDNRSSYGRGVFSDGEDRLGSQAKTVLMTHLEQSGRFRVLDRANMAALQEEAKLSGVTQKTVGAAYIVTGNVTEFGRKNIGDKQLFGILGKGSSQIAYAKVMVNIVDIKTSTVVHSAVGAGEYELSHREVVGFGGDAGYDSTLNGKVLDLAMREAVNHLVADLENNQW